MSIISQCDPTNYSIKFPKNEKQKDRNAICMPIILRYIKIAIEIAATSEKKKKKKSQLNLFRFFSSSSSSSSF